MSTRTARNVTVAVAAFCALSVATAGAASAGPAGTGSAPVASAQVGQPGTEDAHAELMARFAAVPEGATTQQAAVALFPGDVAAQQEYVQIATEVDRAAAGPTGSGPTTLAVPVVLAPYVAVIGSCVAGAIGGAGVAEVINLVRNGQQLSAESRVDAAVGGCITTTVPPFLRPLANSAKGFIVNAVIAIIIRLS